MGVRCLSRINREQDSAYEYSPKPRITRSEKVYLCRGTQRCCPFPTGLLSHDHYN
ncbi:hypothetical protein HMPREF3185_01778 [Porphyromonas somerae]|uniref:Uncharacterized protein n=1 Tax=Porphyromonas somerae TaxID=322095 RepID=A0A134B364_9PORP|nr:hypothetical protein HMPREF3184_01778 [Porphyromonadaceae bacterium KA00676]KXB74377.1 hypothetical protein HMPREF3185_01778 [Porphyromonas somerae]